MLLRDEREGFKYRRLRSGQQRMAVVLMDADVRDHWPSVRVLALCGLYAPVSLRRLLRSPRNDDGHGVARLALGHGQGDWGALSPVEARN
jgi:hypothetical protein